MDSNECFVAIWRAGNNGHNTKNGGIRSTDSQQWNKIVAAIGESRNKNVFI